MARGPDIIERQSIPLAATSDQPVADVPAPPLNASGNAEDLARGVPREITPEEQAVAAAARKGDPETGEITEADAKPPAKAKPEIEAPGDKTVDGEDPTDGEEDPDQVDPTKLPNYANKEIARIRKASRDRIAAATAEATKTAADAAETKAALEKARQDLADLRAKAGITEETDTPAQPEPKPARDQFDDPDAYDEALEAWTDKEAERKAAVKLAERELEAQKARDDAEAAKQAEADEVARVAREVELQALDDAWNASVTTAKAEKYPDWDEVVMKSDTDGGPMVTDVMGAIMVQQPNGTDIAYYLAVNVDESKRIAAIANPFLQAAEIGKLSQQLSQPARGRQRPRPITPVDESRSAAENSSPDDEDMDSYYARRSVELKPNRQPFFPQGGIH